MSFVIAVASGGAIGALMRHGLNISVMKLLGTAFPWGIFIANILGSFIMGVLISIFAHFWEPSAAVKAFLTVGFLGAFTTFSAFSLDAVILIERAAYLQAALYILGSVVLSISGLFCGMLIVRMFA
jgi:CrcB protein